VEVTGFVSKGLWPKPRLAATVTLTVYTTTIPASFFTLSKKHFLENKKPSSGVRKFRMRDFYDDPKSLIYGRQKVFVV
jgi:hypothetical protein